MTDAELAALIAQCEGDADNIGHSDPRIYPIGTLLACAAALRDYKTLRWQDVDVRAMAAQYAALSEQVKTARAQLDALRAATSWRPIESAPRDGTVVDLWVKRWNHETDTFDGKRVTGCRACGGADLWLREYQQGMPANSRPTHWMPLPAPPAPEPPA
jgi:hypothetical protein